MTRMLQVLLFLVLTASTSFCQTYSPAGASPTEHPVFTWPATATATQYNLYLGQFGADTIYNVTPTQAGCASGTGTCTYDPGVTCGKPSGSPVCSQGHPLTWWLDAMNGSTQISDTVNQFYVPIAGVGETITGDYNTNYDFAWDTTPCTKWTFPANFIGGQRRVVDIQVGSGTLNLGIQMFHQAMWNVADISDIVPTGPAGARVALLSVEVGYSATCSAAAGGGTCDLMGWATRRHGTTEQNIPALQYYTSAERDHKIWPVLLDQYGRFDFYWDDGANGIYPKNVNNSTLTGEFVNATVFAFCTP